MPRNQFKRIYDREPVCSLYFLGMSAGNIAKKLDMDVDVVKGIISHERSKKKTDIRLLHKKVLKELVGAIHEGQTERAKRRPR